MTNYTNHTYNSNNDNISITIIWIHFNPFRCTGPGCSWVKMYMPGFTNLKKKKKKIEDIVGAKLRDYSSKEVGGGGSGSVERGRQF